MAKSKTKPPAPLMTLEFGIAYRAACARSPKSPMKELESQGGLVAPNSKAAKAPHRSTLYRWKAEAVKAGVLYDESLRRTMPTEADR